VGLFLDIICLCSVGWTYRSPF